MDRKRVVIIAPGSAGYTMDEDRVRIVTVCQDPGVGWLRTPRPVTRSRN